ncbi:MAG: hypothetical protein M0Q91_07535 [Methanoregula sp.]|jgi:hypothetical protein|nr:hypothetical protein [Methanoregula sp.]
MTCPTKEDRINTLLDGMPEGHIFNTADISRACNLNTHEAGKRLPRTMKAVKVSLPGEPARWMRKTIAVNEEARV